MAKLYQVYTRLDLDKKVTSYVLVQANTLKEANDGAEIAAEFPVNATYDQHTQCTRAGKFAAYLNKIVEMTNELEKGQDI